MDDLESFYGKKADQLKKEKKYEEALLFSQKAKEIRDDEKSSDYWYKKGIHLVELGKFENAIECFDNDILKHQKSYNVFLAKGKVLFQLKRYDEALECFNKAAEEKNSNYLQTSKKVLHLKKAKKFEKALMYSSKASKEFSSDPEFWYFKGATLFRLKKNDEACSALVNAVNLEDNNPKYLYELAKCELSLGNQPKCINLLREAIKLRPYTKEMLQIDSDFSSLHNNNEFRAIIHL